MNVNKILSNLLLLRHVREFCVTHYVIFNVILYAFYELNGGKLAFPPFHL